MLPEAPRQGGKQNIVIDGIEVFANIELEKPCEATGKSLRNFTKRAKSSGARTSR